MEIGPGIFFARALDEQFFKENGNETGTGTFEDDSSVDQGLGWLPGGHAEHYGVFTEEEQQPMKTILYAIFAALIVFPSISVADEAEEKNIKTLDEVVVTATKTEETRQDIPNSVILYDQYDIEDVPAISIGELMANDPGIDWRTQGDSGGAAQTIHIRGMSGEATQVFINGVNINSPSLGLAEVGRLPLNNIANIEVVKGSGSLLYGTGAMGGTVSIFTKRPTRDIVDLKVEGGVGTEQTYHLGFENGLFFSNTMGYFLTASYDETDGFRSNSDLDHKDVSLNLVLDTGDKLDLSLYGQYLDRDFGRPGVKPPDGTEAFYIGDVAVYDSESASLLDRGGDKDGLLVLTANSKLNDMLNITVLADITSMENYNYLRYVNSFSFPATLPGAESWTTNTVYEIEGNMDIAFSDRGDLLLGAEYIRYDWENESVNLDGTGQRFEDSRTIIDADLHSTGIYGELQYQLFSPIRSLAALRYEDNSEIGNETLPRFGIVATPWQNTALKLSSGKHFAAPTPNDLFWPDDGFSKGNPDLLPETGWHSDITWEQSLKDDSIFFSASYFHWTIDDKIQWEPDSNGIYSPVNLRSFTGDGFEAGAKFKLMANLQLGLDYTYIDAVEESRAYTVMDYGWPPDFPANFEYDWVERRAAYTPQHLFKGALTYFTDFGLTLSAVARYTGDRVTYRTETDGFYPNTKTVAYDMDSYWTFDMKLVQQIKDHVFITLLGTNLFDEEYDTYLDSFTDYNTYATTVEGYPGAGRSVFVKLAYAY
ncbi:MAG: TonB-dependent receptor [Desulfobulbales bacterium]